MQDPFQPQAPCVLCDRIKATLTHGVQVPVVLCDNVRSSEFVTWAGSTDQRGLEFQPHNNDPTDPDPWGR